MYSGKASSTTRTPSQGMAMLPLTTMRGLGGSDWSREVSSWAETVSMGPSLRTRVLGAAGRAASARHWFLNPEHARNWNTGDSAARVYGRLIPMVECRNLTQLGEFVHDLA